MPNPMFTQHADGSVSVDYFPDEIVVSHQLLRSVRRIVRKTGFRSFEFVCSNGSAEYRIVKRFTVPGASVCRKVSK